MSVRERGSRGAGARLLGLVLLLGAGVARAGEDGGPSALEDAGVPSPVVLTPLAVGKGIAMHRFAVSGGGIVQLHSGCHEWAAGGTGLLVRPAGSVPRVVSFDSGPTRELRGGVLLVDSQHQVGGDGGDEDSTPRLPAGSRATYQDDTGSIFVSRVLSIELATGTVRDAGWDTFAPVTAGAERFVVLARTHLWARGMQSRKATAYLVWDVLGGPPTVLGEAKGLPAYRTLGDEVIVRVTDARGARLLAVHGTTGAVRPVTEQEARAARVRSFQTKWYPGESLGKEAPAAWRSVEGRPILLGSKRNERLPYAPQVGLCGVTGPLWHQGLLFVDEGVFHWPRRLKLAPAPDAGTLP